MNYEWVPLKRMYLSDIVGKTPSKITVNNEDGGKIGNEIIFEFTDGTACKFYHDQECCESVDIEDINGDWSDLIGTPLLVAEEREGEHFEDDENSIETLYTFYCFRSVKGSVDVRWFGESNGFYSIGVDIAKGVPIHDNDHEGNSDEIGEIKPISSPVSCTLAGNAEGKMTCTIELPYGWEVMVDFSEYDCEVSGVRNVLPENLRRRMKD